MDQVADDTTEPTIEALRELADDWRRARPERQERTHLDRADFDAIERAGFLQSVVPAELGGTWRGPASIRPITTMLRALGAGDPSVALVSSMHPAVLAFWLLIDGPEDPGWQRQRAAVLATAVAGQRWGTITSEPGSGGDILRTRTEATPCDASLGLPGRTYALSGVKHFGSGLGITDWMVTTAVPDGEEDPAIFAFPAGGRRWDGSEGLTLIDEWDGAGMSATQSHGMRLDGLPAVRFGADVPLPELAAAANPFILTLFSAVMVGVLDEAIAWTRERLAPRRDDLGPYEQVGWTDAERRHWLAQQALEGSIAAVERGQPADALHASIRAKQSIALLAEEILTGLGRTVGGGSFSRRSPMAHWFEDVRALGFLRPPWLLAHRNLLDTSW